MIFPASSAAGDFPPPRLCPPLRFRFLGSGVDLRSDHDLTPVIGCYGGRYQLFAVKSGIYHILLVAIVFGHIWTYLDQFCLGQIEGQAGTCHDPELQKAVCVRLSRG